MLIGIAGKSGHGKDTIAEYICKLDPRFRIDKFATGVRKAASIITSIPWYHMLSAEEKKFGLSDLKWETSEFDALLSEAITKTVSRDATPLEVAQFKTALNVTQFANGYIQLDYTVGKLLQLLGTDCFREKIHEDVWVDDLFRGFSDRDFVVISDVRAPNEEQRIHSHKGIVIRVNRPEVDGFSDGRDANHASESWLDGIRADFVFDNSGSLKDLHANVEKFMLSRCN